MTDLCTSTVMASARKRCPRSERRCYLEDKTCATPACACPGNGGVSVLLSAKSLATLGAVVNFETNRTIFRKLEPKTVVQLERSSTGHWWMDLFEQTRVINHDSNSQWWFSGRRNRTSAW